MEGSDDEKENKKNIFLNNNARRSKSPNAIDTLLSLDDTLLCNVETDSGLHTSFKTFSQEYDSCSAIKEEWTRSTAVKTAPINNMSKSRSVSPNEWLDRSLMNQVFAQFDSQNEENIFVNNCDNISNLNIFDTFCKDDAPNRSESHNVKPLSESNQNVERTASDNNSKLHEDKSFTNMPCLSITNFGDDTLISNSEDNNRENSKSPVLTGKCKSAMKCKIPKKRLRLIDSPSKKTEENKETSSTESSTTAFYGLSDTVKKLIQEIKGIRYLYRKVALI